MGEMADYYMDQALNGGEDPFGVDEEYLFGSRSRGGYSAGDRSKHNVTCARCGAKRLKWRETEYGWRLYAKERGENGKKLEHQCGKVSPVDFEVLDGD